MTDVIPLSTEIFHQLRIKNWSARAASSSKIASADAARVAADPKDRREIAEVQELMEALRGKG